MKLVRALSYHLRIQSDWLFSSSQFLQTFLQQSFKIEGVLEVKTNPNLKTIRVRFDCEITDGESLFENFIILKKSIQSKQESSQETENAYLVSLQEKSFHFHSFNGIFSSWQVVRETTGRMRLKNPLLEKNPSYCHQVEEALLNTPGVAKTQASPLTATLLIEFEIERVPRKQIFAILEEVLAGLKKVAQKLEKSHMSIATLTLLLTGMAHYLYPPLMPLAIFFILWSAWPSFGKAWQAIKQKRIKVDLLDSIIVFLCLGFGQFLAAAIMTWIVCLADNLLTKTCTQTSELLSQVFGKQPRFAWLLVDGKEKQVPISKLKKGDIITVSTSEQIPVDGIAVGGEGMVDEHLLTGESAPVEKKEKDQVFANTVLLAGKLKIKVNRTGKSTNAARIVKLINKAANHKTRVQSFGEKFADLMVLPTLGLAGAGFMVGGPASAMAIVNSDYGTGIRVASPIAVLSYLAKAAKQGILIKKGSVLEELPKVDAFLFDKTGTLTREVPEVGEVVKTGALKEDEILRLTATAERRFTHPIAQAILEEAKKRKLRLYRRDDSQYHVGFGIQVGINGDIIKVGSARFMEREKIKIAQKFARQLSSFNYNGVSAILVAVNDELQGILELRSSHRPEARSVIEFLKKRRVKDIVLISGDQKQVTQRTAQSLGIERFYAQVLPQGKADYVKMLQKEGRKVAMVGDGINDSIALSLADVSVSLKGASTIATDVADVVFMDGSLTKLGQFYAISDGLRKNVRRSLLLTAIPNTICIAGALFGVIGFGASLILNSCFNVVAGINGTMPLYGAFEEPEYSSSSERKEVTNGVIRKAVEVERDLSGNNARGRSAAVEPASLPVGADQIQPAIVPALA